MKSSHSAEQHFPKVSHKLLSMEPGLESTLVTDHLHFPRKFGLVNTTSTFLYTSGSTSNCIPCSISKMWPCKINAIAIVTGVKPGLEKSAL